MSSSANAQNLLVNVFRPVYRYEIPPGDSNSIFIPKLEMSNIDTYSGNSVSVFTAAVGDANSNVYVGRDAGNPYTTLNACRFVSAFGYGAAAGISNVSNSTFLGYNAGAGASGVTSNVILGDNAQGNGSSNVRIGSSNTGTGSRNVSVGTVSSTSTYSNCILLGPGITATQDYQFRVGASYLYGDLSTNWFGVGRATPMDPTNGKFDVSGNVNIEGQVGINKIPVRTLDLNGNFRAVDALGTLDFSSGVLTVNGVASSFSSGVMTVDGVTASTGGFASIRGSAVVGNTSNVPIGTLKNGLVMVAVRSGSANFDGRTSFILDTTSPTVSNLSSNKSATTTVNFTSNSINISNTTGGSLTYDWSITYFPLP
jgi:hypothetical protein